MRKEIDILQLFKLLHTIRGAIKSIANPEQEKKFRREARYDLIYLDEGEDSSSSNSKSSKPSLPFQGSYKSSEDDYDKFSRKLQHDHT